MFDEFQREIAAAYAAGDPEPPERGIRRAWGALADDCEARAAGIRLLLRVEETDDPEPYAGTFAAGEMCDDIASGHFIVSRANCEHPIWTPAQNVAFRIVHDVLGHYAATVGSLQVKEREHVPILGELCSDAAADVAGFDWAGENRACAAHGALLRTPDERMALFCECIAQTAYAIERGHFARQHCADLSLWPYEIKDAHRREEAVTAHCRWLDAGV